MSSHPPGPITFPRTALGAECAECGVDARAPRSASLHFASIDHRIRLYALSCWRSTSGALSTAAPRITAFGTGTSSANPNASTRQGRRAQDCPRQVPRLREYSARASSISPPPRRGQRKTTYAKAGGTAVSVAPGWGSLRFCLHTGCRFPRTDLLKRSTNFCRRADCATARCSTACSNSAAVDKKLLCCRPAAGLRLAAGRAAPAGMAEKRSSRQRESKPRVVSGLTRGRPT